MAVRSLNKALIIGNITRDLELRYTSSGTAVVSFGVATNREYSSSNSDTNVEETEFHNVVAWAKLAELCEKLLSKGDKVYIEGRLQTRDWTDEASGKKMYRTEIVASEMILLSGKRGGDSAQTGETFGSQASGGNEDSSEVTQAQPEQSDEIPF